MLLLKIYLANGVILYVDRNQAKRVEKEDEGCDGKKSNIFSWRWSFTIEVVADIQFTRRRRSLKKDRYLDDPCLFSTEITINLFGVTPPFRQLQKSLNFSKLNVTPQH